MFDHKKSLINYVHWFLALPGILIMQCDNIKFIDIFEPDMFLPSNIHSLSENESSTKGVYAVFAALQENPSLQKLE